jgi:multidrug resistance efflux pump
VVVLLVVACLGAWAWFATRPRPATVTRRDIVGQIPLTGQIVVPPSARADVTAPFRARVDRVVASVGQPVRRGDILVQLSVPNAQAYGEQTRATLKAAETAYANARNQYSSAVAAAQRQLDAARTAERTARQSPTPSSSPNATPVEPTPTAGGNPNSPTPSADAGQASNDRIAAEQALRTAVADRDVQLLPYQQQLDAAREADRQARAGEKMGLIRAPIDGTVLALNAQPGKEVGGDPKVPVATIVDVDALQIEAPLDNRQAAYVKVGMPVIVSVPDIPGKQFEGKVSKLTSQVVSKVGGLLKESRYVALIDFKNAGDQVKPDMKPVIALKTGEARDALAVPNDAVTVDSTGRPIVKVLRGGAWQPVVVQAGVSDGRYTQITNGVHAGETVQVTPNLLSAAPLANR